MVVVKNVHWTVLPNKFLSEALICLLFTAQGRKRNKALFESPSDMTFYAFQGWNMTQFRIEFIRPALSKMDFQLKTWENFFLRAHFIIKWTRVLTQLGACAWTRGAQLCVKMRQLWCKKVLMTMMIAWWFWNLYSTKKGQKRSKFIWSCQQRSNSISSQQLQEIGNKEPRIPVWIKTRQYASDRGTCMKLHSLEPTQTPKK